MGPQAGDLDFPISYMRQNAVENKTVARQTPKRMPKRARVVKPPSSDLSCEGRCYGIVKSYNATKGWGFITSDDVGHDADVYFQRRDLPGDMLLDRELELVGVTLNFTLK